MTIDEAIKRLNKGAEPNMGTGDWRKEWQQAIQLGIEALKAYRQARIERQLSPNELLPSETEGEK